jgi:hypothetical protein
MLIEATTNLFVLPGTKQEQVACHAPIREQTGALRCGVDTKTRSQFKNYKVTAKTRRVETLFVRTPF